MDVIPEEVKQFILKNIDSIAEWECVLLLRANPVKEWSEDAIARSLYTSKQETARVLTRLIAGRIIVFEEAQSPAIYRYSPESAEMDNIIGQAAELYRRHLIPITNLIHSKSKTRIQEFADAFKLRKE